MKWVRISWQDSEHWKEAWVGREEAESWSREALPEIVSVGQLLYECSEHVVIVQAASSTSIKSAGKIPRFAILSIEELGVVGPMPVAYVAEDGSEGFVVGRGRGGE